jgi:acyl-CoA reductase-like NAD-dependent aldehyde dehydrogenase
MRSLYRTDTVFVSNLLLRIADIIESNLELLAVTETVDNGKPNRETPAADLPLTF